MKVDIGKRGPKLRYNDILCPNEGYCLFGRIREGNITSKGIWTNRLVM